MNHEMFNMYLLNRVTPLLPLAVLVVATASAGGGDISIERATVDRPAGSTAVVKWRSVPEGAPVDVLVQFPDERKRRLVSNNDRDGMYELSARDAERRPIVFLTTDTGRTVATAERLLPLEGGRNFRDLGGYTTTDGRMVKWGKVFRSGTMTNLTDRDYEFLSTLGIRVVCDFRANEEREREPTLWRTSGERAEYFTRNYAAESDLKQVLGSDSLTAEKVREAMIKLYGELPYEHADSYRTMFKSLAAGEVPLAFNCSAGKDRTGVAAALLLTMLGVPRETIVADYSLSERVVDYEAQFASTSAPERKPGPWDFIGRLPPAIRAPLLRSEPEYIRSALARIETQEGSMETYFRDVLNISEQEQRSIRGFLLEPVLPDRE
jgi:protein-tyrosine phosphatase